jgi:hypothetical protein
LLRVLRFKEFVMPRIALPHFPHITPQAIKQMDSAKTLAGMLLAAVLAALLVVADQLIETWADGHLLVGWVALWTAAFAALALLAPSLRQLSSTLALTVARWSQAAKQRRLENQMWDYARQDPRVMSDLQLALQRDEE